MRLKQNAKQPVSEPALSAQADLAKAVELYRNDPVFLTELARIYAILDEELTTLGATCLGGGPCCKFDLAPHRVYLSTGELALLGKAPPVCLDRCRAHRCPYQIGPRCSARTRRPLGCRIFFCDPNLTDSLGKIYEVYHRKIISLSQTRCLPYLYTELSYSLLQLFS